jgi:hypothetical protein
VSTEKTLQTNIQVGGDASLCVSIAINPNEPQLLLYIDHGAPLLHEVIVVTADIRTLKDSNGDGNSD